jgi:hypothetical protein
VKERPHALADRIRGTVLDLDGVTDRAMRSWSHAQKALQDRDVYLDSAALNIHGFYSGMERIFEIEEIRYEPRSGEDGGTRFQPSRAPATAAG